MNAAFPTCLRLPWKQGCLVAAFVCLVAGAALADSPEGSLIWNNGETLKGRFAASGPDSLGWQAEPFNEPLALRLFPLRRVEFSGDDEMSKEPFAVFLTDGSRLHGDIVAMDADTLTLRSQRHGTVVLKRAGLLRIQRMTGGGILYGGPCGASGWTASSEPSGRSDLPRDTPHTGRAGVMIAPGWNHRTALNLSLPEKLDIQFRLSSTEQPAFGLEVVGGDTPIALQTWGDEVVLLWGSRFVSLSRLNAGDRAVSLHMILDQPQKRCRIFTGDGTPMCDWQNEPGSATTNKETAPKTAARSGNADVQPNALTVMAQALISLVSGESRKSSAKPRSGLVLQNRGRDLTLEQMSVREWSGKEPVHVNAEHPFVARVDGTALQGVLSRIADGAVTVKPEQGGEQSLPLAELDTAEFGVTPAKDPPPAQTELWTADGSLVTGRLLDMGEDNVRLQTSFAHEPVSCQISGIRRINLDVPPPQNTPEELPLTRQDRLVWATITLHGAWSATGDAQLHWLPVGALKPVSVNLARHVEITRAIPPDASVPPTPALFHLSTGEILPGALTSMDEDNVGIEAPLLGIKQIPTTMLRAIQFPGLVEAKGFKDRAWEVMRGGDKNVTREDDRITLQPGTSFGHPLMMQSDEVRFSVMGDHNSFTSLRVRLFTNGSNDRASETRLMIAHYSNRIYAGLEQNEGDFVNRCQVNVSSEQPAAIRLVPHPKDVEIFINGASMLRVPSDLQKRKGVGIVFEPGNLWGNGEYPVVVSDFMAVSNPGRAWLPGVDATARSQALLVPRFRKDSPPRQILIAANGDLLRGELLAGTKSHFAFKVGLDTLQIPRERVTTAVWLQKPVDDKKESKNEEAKKEEIKKDGSELDPPPPNPFESPLQLQAKAQNSEGDKKEELHANANDADADEKPTHWLQLVAGARFALTVEKIDGDAVFGHSAFLGKCRIPFSTIYRVRNTEPDPDFITKAFDNWKLEYAPEPEITGSDGSSSPLLNKDAPDFELPLLAGDKFQLQSQKGKVVVLDFWATWCAPCVRSMPELIEALSAFPPDQVRLVGVNQGESPDQVKHFLEQRGWKLEVALDRQQKAGMKFGVEGIPHTVIVGPDGKVAWANTGYSPNAATDAANAVRKLLEGKH